MGMMGMMIGRYELLVKISINSYTRSVLPQRKKRRERLKQRERKKTR